MLKVIVNKICNFIDITRKSMTEKELNLKKINESIESIVDKSSANDVTKEEIASIGLTILKPLIWRPKSLIIIRILVAIFSTLVLLFCVKNIEPLNKLTAMYGRVLLFETEPYWDWNKWYESSCLLNNPYYKVKPLREKDCYSCEDIVTIEKKDEIKSEIIAEKYCRNRIPVIIISDILMNEMKRWPIAKPDFGLDAIEQIYDENDWKNVCMFRSNIKAYDHLNFIKKVKDEKFYDIGWYAHWENCAKKTEKRLRTLYNRPSILPSMLELTKSNWLLISNNYIASKYKQIDPLPSTQVLIMIQIKGENRIRLDPKEFCQSRGCSSIEQVVHQNELLVMSSELWQLWYAPNNSAFNLAIVIGAIYT